MEETKKELGELMNAVMVTFLTMASLDEGNEKIMSGLEINSNDLSKNQASEKIMDKVLGPVLPRIMDLMMQLAFSGVSEEEMKGFDPFSVLTNDSSAFMENFEQNVEKAEMFLDNTSKENQIVVAQVVKATAELNGIITELEQGVLNEFCQKYNISEEELMGSKESAELMEMFLNSSKESEL